jgi:hypothetical protein
MWSINFESSSPVIWRVGIKTVKFPCEENFTAYPNLAARARAGVSLPQQPQLDCDPIGVDLRAVFVDVHYCCHLAAAKVIPHMVSNSRQRWAIGGLANEVVIGILGLIQKPDHHTCHLVVVL